MKKFSKLLFIAIFAIAVLFAGKNVQAADVPCSKIPAMVTKTAGLIIYQPNAENTDKTTTPYKNSSGDLIMAEYGWIVDVVAKNGSFYKVQFYYGDVSNQLYGYISASGVKVATAPSKETFTKVYGYVGVAKYDKIDVRSTSNYKKVIKIIAKDSTVNIVAQSNSWYKVQVKVSGVVKTGYIFKGLLKKTNALTDTYMNFSFKTNPKMGKKYKFTLKDKCPIALNKKVTWKSSNKSVVVVTKTGKFKIKKSGNAVISCKIKVGNRSKTFKFKLTDNRTYKFYK